MRWQGGRESDNVEDQRGSGGGMGGFGGGRMVIGGGMGMGGLLIILLLICMGVDPRQLLQNMPAPQQQGPGPGAGMDPGGPVEESEEEAELRRFTSVILANTEDVWRDLFRSKLGREYEEPKLTLFSGSVNSACGFAESATGPFYCPLDDKVYLDMSFFDELQRKFNAPGDFAQAYVIAHEIGHHVQNQLGINEQVQRAQQRTSKVEANQLSVRLELQADYLAGVWAHHANRDRKLLEEGDIEEGFRAAFAIGDDRLQKMSTGRVMPDSFTHGSSEQRVGAFRDGLRTGDFSKAKLQKFFDSDL